MPYSSVSTNWFYCHLVVRITTRPYIFSSLCQIFYQFSLCRWENSWNVTSFLNDSVHIICIASMVIAVLSTWLGIHVDYLICDISFIAFSFTWHNVSLHVPWYHRCILFEQWRLNHMALKLSNCSVWYLFSLPGQHRCLNKCNSAVRRVVEQTVHII